MFFSLYAMFPISKICAEQINNYHLTGLSGSNNKQQSQTNLCQSSSMTMQGRPAEHATAPTAVQRILMAGGLEQRDRDRTGLREGATDK